jgi:phospholipid N-methyltransferase
MNSPSADTAYRTGRKWRTAKRSPGPLTLFFREFLKNPAMIGSVIPSSDKLIDRMLSRVDWDKTKVFVEYGPGVGTFTRPILDRLAPDGVLVAIDVNPDFIDYMSETVIDPRLILVRGSAADVVRILADRGLNGADYVLSGLPFSTLPPGVGPDIVEATYAALNPGGAFVVYQYAVKVLSLLRPHFREIDRDFEPLNIPPAQVFWAWKE